MKFKLASSQSLEISGKAASYYAPTLSRSNAPPFLGTHAFTLLELMIVIAIMGIILTMGVPIVYRMRHEAPLRRGVKDVVEVCSHARAMAILQSKAVCVVFHPREMTFGISGGSPSPKSNPAGEVSEAAFLPPPSTSAGTSGRFSEQIAIEMLDVDLSEYKDADEVKVCGDRELDFAFALRWLRGQWGVKRLLCEGGGEINAALLQAGLVNEIHLTLCPVIFGGRSAPTMADGHGFTRLADAARLRLISRKRKGDELFLVYKVLRKSSPTI